MGEEIIPEKMPLNIFYEDDELLIINKPPGLVVHPASGNYPVTLINGVAYYLQEKNNTDHGRNPAAFRSGSPDRQKHQRTACMAKTARAVASLAKQFFDHTVKRQYRCPGLG